MIRGGIAFLVFLTAVAASAVAQTEFVPGPPPGAVVRPGGRGLVPPAVLPPDRVALEQVLTSALEGVGPDQPMGRTMPSTASLEIVASASFARRTGEPCIGCRNPCRNFRYTYVRPDRGSVSVEGTRCRRPNGRWAPLTPDMVVAESPARPGLAARIPPGAIPMPPEPVPGPGGAPAGRAVPMPPVADAVPLPRPGRRDTYAAIEAVPDADVEAVPGPDVEAVPGPDVSADEPEAPLDLGPGEAPPEDVSPAADAARAALSDGTGEAPADAADEPPPPPAAEPPAAAPSPPAAEPPASAAAPSAEEPSVGASAPVAGPVDAPAPPAAGATEPPAAGSDQVAAASPSAGGTSPAPAARVVMPFGGKPDPAGKAVTVETVADPELVRLLRQLSYLDPATTAEPSKAALDAAVAEFAGDEGIAMPAPTEEIKRRLEAAVDRNGDLASCGDGAPNGYGVCLEKKP